ncbi:MAG: tetratricopeptide repeat protein [Paludibacteraceae bacterium]|nr:tetratricopeptide repeat protein [Paludibacteraceae bacterium]
MRPTDQDPAAGEGLMRVSEEHKHTYTARYVVIVLCMLFGLTEAGARVPLPPTGPLDTTLLHAYLREEMQVWRTYIDTTCWETADSVRRLQVLNYEYGFTAYMIDSRPEEAAPYLNRFRSHIRSSEQLLTPARYATYLSAAHAYTYRLNSTKVLSCAWRSYRLAHRAAETAPDDPLALTLLGNVYFYAPSLLGGDKQRALDCFNRADSLMQTEPESRLLWNYPAMRLCIAQCYEKTGDTAQAAAAYRELLRLYPDFLYVKTRVEESGSIAR